MSATFVIADNPFAITSRTVHQVKRRYSIKGFLKRQGYDWAAVKRLRLICQLNGKPLLRADWGRRLRKDDLVVVQALPAGGGNMSKIIGAVVIMIIATVMMYFAPGSGTALYQIGISLLISATLTLVTTVVSMLIPAPKPTSRTFGDAQAASPTYSLQAQGNTARLGQPLPVLYGRQQVFPDFVSLPYQRFENNEQYLFYLLGVTVGECDMETPKIRDTPLDRFADVTWHKIEPGAPVPPGIADARVLTSAEVGEANLEDATLGSPWKGPFLTNPPATAINTVEFDIGAPKGLYYANDEGGLDDLGFTIEAEVQRVNDLGDPAGDWIALTTMSKVAATVTPLRWTEIFSLPAPGRYQMRMRRTDPKSESARAGHEAVWFGIRGVLVNERRFPGMTVLAMKLRASGQLSDLQTRNISVVATRRLRTLQNDGAMSTTVAPTRSPADAMADMLMASYGGNLPLSRVDIWSIYEGKAAWDGRGWTFDGVFDTSRPLYEALTMCGRVVRSLPIPQGGRVRLVRDEPASVPVAMFTARNIVRGSLETAYILPTEETADAVTIEYMDPVTWKPREVTVALPDSTAQRPTRLSLFGCSNRAQARWVGWYFINCNRYRRRLPTWRTEMEGLSVVYGDPVVVTHDLPSWGQSAEAVAFDLGTRTLRVSEELIWTEGAPHFIALRKRDGTMAGPFEAVAGNDVRTIVVGTGDLPTIDTGGDRERTHVAFGKGTNWGARLKIAGVIPRASHLVELRAVDDDPRVYTDPPDEVIT